MSKRAFDCPECGTKVTVSANTASPIQCCPFCGNTILPAEDNDEDDGGFFDDEEGD